MFLFQNFAANTLGAVLSLNLNLKNRIMKKKCCRLAILAMVLCSSFSFGQQVWAEDFSGLTDGASSDTGQTAWTTTITQGTLTVQTEYLLLQGDDASTDATWSSEEIDISNHTDIGISFLVSDSAIGEKESNDYVRGYYILDNGSRIQFSNIADDIATPTIQSITGLNGSTLKIEIDFRVSFGNETYTIDDVLITGTSVSSPSQNDIVRINSGGPAVTHDGKQFDADQYFVGGTLYSNTAAQISELYHTERSGTARTFDYDIPLTNGDYDISLHFADIYWGATGGGVGGIGKRIFDVSIEGNNVLDNYDIYAEVGGETPSIKNYTVTVSDGELNLNFSSLAAVGGVDQAKVSAIEVVPAGSGTGGGLWTTSGTNDIYFNSGNVGIGVTNPDAPLTVKGRIHSTEVKVDMLGALVPDYVFLKEYDLKTLEEVELAIKELGHLPKIPSAKEMKENGMELKAMNLSLLEKIEELTLYIIQQNKSQKQLEERIQVLETQK